MRKLFWILAALLVLALGAMLALDVLVAGAVRRAGTYALGVETSLDGAHASLLHGELALERLEIANPPGFPSAKFLSVRRAALAVSPASLAGDVVEVPVFELEGVQVHLERTREGTNYGRILDALKRFESEPAPESTSAGEKKFIVRKVRLRQIEVFANVAPELGASGQFSLTIPELELNDVGTADGGRTVGALVGDLVTLVLAAALERGAGVLPKGMLDDLQGSLSKLGGRVLDDLHEQLGAALDGVGQEARKALDGIGEELDKLFK